MVSLLTWLAVVCIVRCAEGSTPVRPPSPGTKECYHPKPPHGRIKCDAFTHYELCPRPDCWQYCSFLWSKQMKKKYHYIPTHRKEDCVEQECCHPSCVCDKGYYRDDTTDLCVSYRQCMKPCGENEEFTRNSTVCRRSCDNWQEVDGCRNPYQCEPYTGCVCQYGYARLNADFTGPCVEANEITDDCPNKCWKPHETWNPCRAHCQDTCDNYDDPDRACSSHCHSGCICEEGFVRNCEGDCVTKDRCPKDCPKHEHYDCCPDLCPRDSCAQYNPDFECPQLPAIPLPCHPDCVCDDGFMRNPEGVCIPRHKCPMNQTCGVNEIFSKCKKNCPQTCKSKSIKVRCPRLKRCFSGCDCKPGYLRDEYEQCIPADQCSEDQECGINENYSTCGSYCPRTCNNRYMPPRPCIALCKEGCECSPGFLKHDDGTCVDPDECSNPECPANSHYDTCGTACPTTCNNYGKPQAPCLDICVEGCFCDDGFIKDGMQCVKPKDCPKPECPVNSHYETCGTACETTCNNYGKPPPPCVPVCVDGCFCNDGFIKNGIECVKPKDCPIPICGENEVSSPCGFICPPQSCESIYTDYACPPHTCTPGCNCIDEYLRNASGICIPSEKCPTYTCPINETYVDCEQGYCVPKKCEDLGYPVPCPDMDGPCDGGCVCIEGLVRDIDGTCIPKEQCPSCGGDKNARSGYSNHCGKSCKDYNKPPRPCPYFLQYNGCDCLKGYVYDDVTDKCVLPEECPDDGEGGGGKPHTCPKNEQWVKCEANVCIPKRCSDLGYPLNCTKVDEKGCPGGCICNSGLVRDSKGKCIAIKDCPSCGGDTHATQGCGVHCRNKCSDYQDKDKDCGVGCIFNGCDCKQNYVFNEDTGKCILPKDCPNTCQDPNAEQVSCASACPPTCAKPSPGICPAVCGKGGCNCKRGYILSKIGGKCIKISDCPTNLGCNGDNNSTIIEFPSPCPPTCDERKPKVCTDVIIFVGCQCKPGYIKSSKSGPCIKPVDCKDCNDGGGKPHTCPKNEQWVKCKANVCIPKRCSDLGYPLNCTKVDEKCCPGGCICNSGLVRDSKGKCIAIKDCPSCGGDPHATQGCGGHCRNKCSDYQDKDKLCGIGCILNGCNCREGYVFNEVTKKCILPKDCPSTCKDPNAEQVSCATACPPTCAKPSPGACAAVCVKNGCSCKHGYILSKINGTCIKISDCPTNLGCNGDKNSTIKEFPSPCPPSCNVPEPKICPAIAILVGCACNPGYIKSSSGSCISPVDCGGDKPCGKNATYAYCNVNCPNDKCPVNDDRGIIACDPPYPCPSGCHCKINYRRKSDTDHTCILASECPPVNCTRPNEMFDPCPSACLAERCEDVHKQPVTCNTLLLNCQPQCVCRKGYYRNSEDICIPANKCPNTCKDPNAERVSCARACPPTCAKPTQRDRRACIKNGCNCKRGYILSKNCGKCIKISDCPTNLGCNGDKNSTIKELPSACPPTCDVPEPNVCPAVAVIVGCQCNPGYIKSRSGLCINPLDCGGDKPCGKNATYVSCNLNCRSDYCPVDDSRVVILCDPVYPCPSGCHCKTNYRRKSEKDHTCILASECPPVNCTRPYEEFDPCPSACLAERCQDVDKQPVTCNTLLLNCQPQCVCMKGYYRNSDGICIPANTCPRCGPNEHYLVNTNECRKTCSNIHPPAPPSLCKPTTGCFCDDGFVRMNKDASGPCIKADRCSH